MAAVDSFRTKAAPETMAPATSGEAVTPHDTTQLAYISKALWVGSTGNIAVLMEDGTTLTFANVPNGTWMPLRVKRVNSTSTTASSIVAVY